MDMHLQPTKFYLSLRKNLKPESYFLCMQSFTFHSNWEEETILAVLLQFDSFYRRPSGLNCHNLLNLTLPKPT